MNLTLKRTDNREDGIFGVLTETDSGKQVAVTLEHSYDSGLGNGSYAPKVPPGIYKCARGMHKLHNMRQPFETFEVMGVKGHKGILFHVGNWNNDSEGCILVGHGYGGDPRMISQSRMTFSKFMALQHGINEFTLIVE